MFSIFSHDDGFRLIWAEEDKEAAEQLLNEFVIEGVQRQNEWDLGVVVDRYRNEYETFDQVATICARLGISLTVDPELQRFIRQASSEAALFGTITRDESDAPEVDPKVNEFPTRQLLPYQALGVARHLRNQHSADFSVPGSGKTTVALAYWSLLKQTIPDIGLWIIGPLSCFRPWEDEFLECFGRAPVEQRVRGTPSQRTAALRRALDCELVLCNYHTAWREESAIAGILRRRPWLLVLDEAHYIKSMSGALSNAARNIAPHATRRLLLTGTPMPRSPHDIWSLFTFLWPSVVPLGNAQQFELRVKDRPTSAVCEELRQEVAPLFHRTCKQDLNLPKVDISDYAIDPASISPSQRLIIRLIEQKTLEESRLLAPRDRRYLKRWRRARIIRLMQAASNPELLADALTQVDIEGVGAEDSDQLEPSADTVDLDDSSSDLAQALARYRDRKVLPAKAQYVAERTRQLVSSGEKVVIWAHFQRNIELMANVLADLRPLCVTGSVPAYESEEDEDLEETREQRIALFKTNPDRAVLIASAAACAESISLHRCCQHALYLERSFNAAHFLQSIDRIHRQGMPPGKTAHVEIPYIPCAIERVVNQRLARRQTDLYRLLDDPMPVVGFDDEADTGFYDLEDFEDIDALFDEVLREIRASDG
jgi:SNF2 family DNA or RNA helicase